jgi:hypothetical protein
MKSAGSCALDESGTQRRGAILAVGRKTLNGSSAVDPLPDLGSTWLKPLG